MTKEKQKPNAEKANKSTTTQEESGAWWRSGVIIGALIIVFFAVYQLNASYGEMEDLRIQLNDLKDNPEVNEQKIQAVQHRLHEIHVDTGFLSTLFLGYFVDVHNVAFKINEQLDRSTENIRAQKQQLHLEQDPITREDKLRYKVNTYLLMERINKYLPPNAVILLPPRDSIMKDETWNYVYDPMWVEYFIYPRLCIESGTEKQNPELAKMITHVLIVKGIGYDKLKYDVPANKRERLCVLPVNEPLDSVQKSN